tara:strand:+ start:1643 stop:2299 length:657 start_codon:yes stop_codon:yes gene_type:complete
MRPFRIRCSAINSIMAKPTGKRIISAGAETFVKKWYIEKVYNRYPEVKSKYMDKGIEVEEASIEYVAKKLNLGKVYKNDEWFENDYMHGTPDAVLDDTILEIKNSWDCFSFPLLETEVPSKDYFLQTQGYMHLTGIKKAKLIYVLMDTPEHLIEKDFRWNNPRELAYEDFREKYLFTTIEDKYRIKTFDIEYDTEIVEQIYNRVDLCREYIDKITINK